MFRKTIFWIHLSCGVVAGLVILMMSVTGVLLTYERQMLAWVDRDLYVEAPSAGAKRLSAEALLDAVRAQDPAFTPSSISFQVDPRAPVALAAGRADSRNVNPYTGEVLPEAASRLHAFFDTMTGWHRWFNVSDENRDSARAITGASNLMFLFLVLSGMYLWLPPIYRWAAFRARLVFNPKAQSSKARDFNWHHVVGIWSAIPLVVIVASATVFNYDWADNLVYRIAGEEPPPPRGGPASARPAPESPAASRNAMPLDRLIARAAAEVPGWRKLTLTLPVGGAAAEFTLDRGNGGQPQYRQDLTLAAATGDIVESTPFSSVSPGRQARSMLRFLHTGEALGIAGQTIAGIVSATSAVMVWTGISLAWRRLISPFFRRRRLAGAREEISDAA
ncbi:MAG: PepSY-associated TM helix domain-containing protein [Woeseia sp.]